MRDKESHYYYLFYLQTTNHHDNHPYAPPKKCNTHPIRPRRWYQKPMVEGRRWGQGYNFLILCFLYWSSIYTNLHLRRLRTMRSFRSSIGPFHGPPEVFFFLKCEKKNSKNRGSPNNPDKEGSKIIRIAIFVFRTRSSWVPECGAN